MGKNKGKGKGKAKAIPSREATPEAEENDEPPVKVKGKNTNTTTYACEKIQCKCVPGRFICGEDGSIGERHIGLLPLYINLMNYRK